MFMSSFDSTIIEEFIVTLIFDIYKRIIYYYNIGLGNQIEYFYLLLSSLVYWYFTRPRHPGITSPNTVAYKVTDIVQIALTLLVIDTFHLNSKPKSVFCVVTFAWLDVKLNSNRIINHRIIITEWKK